MFGVRLTRIVHDITLDNEMPVWTHYSIYFSIGAHVNVFPSVRKLTIRDLLQHHKLHHVTSRMYCKLIVKFYNFVFEKIHKNGSTAKGG